MKILEECIKESKKLLKDNVRRISINPTIVLIGTKIDKSSFIHFNYNCGHSDMYHAQSFEDLLEKINLMIEFGIESICK